MRFVRSLSCLAFGALSLAACSKPAANAPGSAAAAASSAAGAPASSKDAMGPEIPADQLPVIKAGLWETTESSPGKKPVVNRSCESGKRKPMNMGQGCQKLSMRRSLLGKYVIDTQCNTGGMELGMHVEAIGDFQSHWSADFTSNLKMPGKPAEVDTSHKEARYVGPCPAGLSADD